MNKPISLLFCLFVLPVVSYAQTGSVTVTGSNIVDSSETPLANGTIYFIPVNNSGQSISYRMDGRGQALSTVVSANVANGGFSITLADTSLTSPANICFAVTVINNVSGDSVLGPGYDCVQPAYNTTTPNNWCSAGNCNFDNYLPNSVSGALVTTGPQGPTGPTGSISFGTVTVGTSATQASVTNSGTPQNAILNFVLPLAPSATDTTKLPLAGGSLTGSLTVPLTNNVINPTLYTGADLGAQINGVQSGSLCSSACTISVPPGHYSLATEISITNADVKLIGFGAVLTGSSRLTAMLTISGNRDLVQGFTFALNNSRYGIISTGGTNQQILQNNFGGKAALYVAVSGSPSGDLISNNSFDGTTGCAFQNNISVFDSAQVVVSNNRAVNTCGFAIESSASNNITIQGNAVRQDTQMQSIAATSGQTTFVFNWPGTIPTVNRVWIQANGQPTTATSVTYTSATQTTVVMPAQTAGAVVTALGWTGLENIQANSQSFNVTIDNNNLSGGGDAGIDVVSDYHMVSNGSQTATLNQRIFTITASPGITAQALPVMNGRVLTPDLASISIVGSTYTITLNSPAPTGTVVGLVDWTLNTGASVSTDYPGSVTIQGNAVKDVASACIAPEVGVVGVVIQGNIVQDCGQGVFTPSYSSGIFTGGSTQLSVKNNTIINSLPVPTMSSAISIQCVACETGAIEKPVVISGNTYVGTFLAGKLSLPPFRLASPGSTYRTAQPWLIPSNQTSINRGALHPQETRTTCHTPARGRA